MTQENEKPEHYELVLDNLPKQQMEFAGHNWRQRGTYVECQSCPVPHGFFVNPDVKFCGLDEKGIPKLKRI